jgi:hypothetical protein
MAKPYHLFLLTLKRKQREELFAKTAITDVLRTNKDKTTDERLTHGATEIQTRSLFSFCF